jgi:hypothetical protein
MNIDLAWVIFPPRLNFQKSRFMYLSALSIGYAVPQPAFEASVHSVFESAVNLRLVKSERLLTLVGSGEADLPQGIRLDTPADFSFADLGVGESVTCQDSILRIDSIPLTADLRKARIWKCDLPALRVDLTDPAVETAWRSVWQALNKHQIQSNAEIIAKNLFLPVEAMRAGVPRVAGKAMQDLVNTTRRYDVMLAASSVRALIGLGTGLTPSGDDLLIGYLAGLWCTIRDEDRRSQFLSNLGKTIIHHSQLANDISRTYLYHASQGQVSSRLADLAEAISKGMNHKRLSEITEASFKVGHTSGMDAVTGLLVGLAAWDIFPTPIINRGKQYPS